MVIAPLLIPFATAIGLPIAGLTAIEIGKKVQDFVENNPEKSNKILTSIKESALMTLPGSTGLNTLFKKKAKPVEEEIEISIEDKDPRDLTREEKAAEMKKRFKEGGGNKREIGKKGYEEVIKPSKDIEDLLEGEERYDGGIEEIGKSKGFDYKKFFKADGGRVNYGLGGLTTQGQRLYDSMSNYGFNEMEIASALDEQQLYPESMTLGLQTEAVAPPRIQPILPINEGGDTQPTPPRSPNYGYAPSKDLSIQDIGEGTITEEEEEFFKEGQRERGMETLKGLGSILGFASNPLFFLAKKGYNMYQDNVQKGIDETNRLEQEKFQRQLVEQQAIKEAARLQQIRDYGNYGESGGSYSGRGDEGATTANFSGDFATDSLSYDLKDGGLATMFVRRR